MKLRLLKKRRRDIPHDNMFKIKKTFRVFNERPFNLQEELDKVRKTMFRLIFALAMSLGVSPKKLAKFYDAKKMDSFAKDFHEELLKAEIKEHEKLQKALNTKTRKK